MYLFPTHTERMLWAFLTWMPGRRKGDVSVVQITFLHQISGHCQGLWSAAHLLSEKGQGTGNVIVSRQYSEREGSRTMRLGVFFSYKTNHSWIFIKMKIGLPTVGGQFLSAFCPLLSRGESWPIRLSLLTPQGNSVAVDDRVNRKHTTFSSIPLLFPLSFSTLDDFSEFFTPS